MNFILAYLQDADNHIFKSIMYFYFVFCKLHIDLCAIYPFQNHKKTKKYPYR